MKENAWQLLLCFSFQSHLYHRLCSKLPYNVNYLTSSSFTLKCPPPSINQIKESSLRGGIDGPGKYSKSLTRRKKNNMLVSQQTTTSLINHHTSSCTHFIIEVLVSGPTPNKALFKELVAHPHAPPPPIYGVRRASSSTTLETE